MIRQLNQNPVYGRHSRSYKGQPLVSPVHIGPAGRLRCKVAGLYRSERLKIHLEAGLRSQPGIITVQANPLTGNLLLLFQPGKPLAEIIQLVEIQLTSFKDEVTDSSRHTPRSQWPGNVTSLVEHRRQHAKRFADPVDLVPRSQYLQPWYTLPADAVLSHFDSSADTGLSNATVQARYAQYGPNLLTEIKQRSEFSMLVGQFASLPVGLLAASAVVSVLTGGVLDAVVIMGVVAINAGIGYLTERQSEKTISALTRVTTRSAQVLRNGIAQVIPIADVVVGDILLLSPGTYVAADVRLLMTHNLTVDESALTGESMPVVKVSEFLGVTHTSLAERQNMAYMGTLVTGGSGLGVVVATAMHTELGQIQTMVGETRPPETPMQQQLHGMGTQLAILSGAVCAGIFGIGLLRGFSWIEMLKASTSLAVAAVPEGLPAVATTTLALGIKNMRRHNVAVRHLDAVETLGTVQVFCMDKTGTLTLNRMAVVAISVEQHKVILSEGQFISDGKALTGLVKKQLRRLLEVASLCSEVELEGGRDNYSFTGSPTEVALVEAARDVGIDIPKLQRRYPRLEVQYRAENRSYMRTLHRSADGKCLVAIKGSPSEVLAMCSHYLENEEVRPLDQECRNSIHIDNEQMAGEALRVLGVAYGEEDESEATGERLIWLGLVGMADPLRTGMDKLMTLFHQAGVKTMMITGDQSATAYSIGKQLGLSGGRPLKILDSSSLDKVDPGLLTALVKDTHVFARVSPAHKLQIVQALQRSGNVVAMTGDGINDGPALTAADIGVAMGQSGTDVARSVSDVVLQDDNLHTMTVAIAQGRTIYSNIRKTIHFLLSTNLTEIEVVTTAIVLGMGQPLNPMQLLWINLISDIFPGLALSLEPAEPDVLKRSPREAQKPIIQKGDLKRMGAESAIISASTLASYVYGLLRYGPGAKANTQAFTTLSFAQLLHALSCRSESHSIFSQEKLPTNPYLNLALGGTLSLQLLAALAPGLRKLLGTSPLGILDGLVVAAGATLPLLINEATKATPDSTRRHSYDNQTMHNNTPEKPLKEGF